MEGTTSQSVNGADGQVSTIESLCGSLVISEGAFSWDMSRMLYDKTMKSLCDLILVVEGKECHAHRAVLASASAVFKTMFTNGMKESNPSSYPQKIPLPEETSGCWQNVLRFIYAGKTSFRGGKSVIELLHCAHKYQLKNLVSAISGFLQAQITTENALELYNYSILYELKDLEDASFTCLEEGFEEAHAKLDYILCPKPLIFRLLKSGRIEIVSELVMLHAALGRMKAREEKSRDEAWSILQWVRMDRMCLSELIEAGLALGKHEPSCLITNHLMEAMLKNRSSDTLSCVSMHDHSFLMRCKRYDRPFTFVQTFSGIASGKHFRMSGHGNKVKLEGRWIDDPRKRFTLQLELVIYRQYGEYNACVDLHIKPQPITNSHFSVENVSLPTRFYIVDLNGKVNEISPRVDTVFWKDATSATPEFIMNRRAVPYAKMSKSIVLGSKSASLMIGANIVLPDW